MPNSQSSTSDSTNDTTTSRRKPSWLSIVATGVAIIAIILALTLRSCTQEAITADASISTGYIANGLSAYELWLQMGNSGTEQDFLDSLIGESGPDGYVGSDGITGSAGLPGSNGVEGKSAYQLWLDAGYSGSPLVFLDSLVGDSGTSGIQGLSAYELWLAVGNHGTIQHFLDSLVGVAGATGSTGSSGTPGQSGLSAFEIWLAQGNVGTASYFLASLVGLTGSAGATGTTGAQGIPGLPGAVGPAGADGATGPAGAVGATGPTGPAGLSGLGYSGSYFSTVTQSGSANAIQAMTLNSTDWQTGIALQNGSQIKILNTGHYNLAFSAQMHQTNSSGIVKFWLAKNGVAMPFTNTKMDITANSPYLVAAWNFFINASANDYYQLMWSSSSGSTEILNEPSEGTGAAEHPAIPSVIVTVNQVG